MDKFKAATRQKLRFQTAKGPMSTEQLWDLSIKDLDALAVELDEEHGKSSKKKSFLNEKSDEDKTSQLRFEIALDILNTRVEDKNRASKAKETKERKNYLLDLIESKKEDELKSKSLEELQAMVAGE